MLLLGEILRAPLPRGVAEMVTPPTEGRLRLRDKCPFLLELLMALLLLLIMLLLMLLLLMLLLLLWIGGLFPETAPTSSAARFEAL